MAAVVLYTNPMSRGRIAHWMLEEAGVGYDISWLEWGPAGSASKDYRSLNKMMKVPTLVHGDKVVTEAAAICLYVADAFPQAGLAPDPADRADYYRWTLFAAGPVEQAVTTRAMGWNVPDDRQKQGMLGFGSFERTMDTLEAMLSERHYVCGERFTAADVYVGSAVSWGLQFGTIPKRAAFQSYAERLHARDAYMRASAINDAKIAEGQARG